MEHSTMYCIHIHLLCTMNFKVLNAKMNYFLSLVTVSMVIYFPSQLDMICLYQLGGNI